VTENL